MANEKELYGLPQIIIEFKTKSVTAIARSARGIVAMILNNEDSNESKQYIINDSTDIPSTGLSAKNVDLIKKCLLGTPLRILVYTLPTNDVTVADGSTKVGLTDVEKKLKDVKWNYVCFPTGQTQDQEDLATWVKSQRSNKRKTFKAVVAHFDADDRGVINFTTDQIRVTNPDYTDALELANYDASKVDTSTTPQFITYTAAEYTARIAGVLAGLSLDRSATYYQLSEVYDCAAYDDIDESINKGELCLIDELDGDGVKIARAVNSLHTFTTDVGESFRKIKIMEGVDMVTDDIRDTFRHSYVGKLINDYNNKMAFIGAVLVYFDGLKGNVLDASETAVNTIDIDENAQANYITLHGLDNPKDLTKQQIREYNTGSAVYLAGRLTFVDAMEDLKIDFDL